MIENAIYCLKYLVTKSFKVAAKFPETLNTLEYNYFKHSSVVSSNHLTILLPTYIKTLCCVKWNFNKP